MITTAERVDPRRHENVNPPEVVERLVEENQGLVGHVIGMYFKRAKRHDLFADGLQGLLRAAELWEESRGVKFTTYACRAIFASISKSLDKTWSERKSVPYSPVKHEQPSPSNVAEMVEKEEADRHEAFVRSAADQLLQSLCPRERDVMVRRVGGETLESIAETIGVSRQRVQQLYAQSVDRIRRSFKGIGEQYRESLERIG